MESNTVTREWTVPLIKSDTEEQYVYGVVLVPDVPDLQGDVISAEDIRKAAHDFMSRQILKLQHSENTDKVLIRESFIAPVDFTLNQYKVVKGTWLLGVHIQDDALWQEVKKGSYTGFSIGGKGRRQQIV